MSDTTVDTRAPAVELAVRTDPGRDPDKQVNEDSHTHLETKLGLLAVVCDGMGGHAGGKEASELAIKSIVEIVDAAPLNANPGLALKRAIEEANARIWGMPTQEAGFRPGSTVVALIAHEGGAEIAHVGDSRLYLIHAGAISQVTRDHSMVQEMVDRGIIRAEDAAKHPDANKILRALGIAKDVEVELRKTPLGYVNGDVLVLCSDGLSDLVEPAEILDIAGSHPPKQAAAQLVDLANARGGHDNITAMVIRMKASATVQNAGESARIAKTMPLTAVAPTLDGGAGPTGTVVGPPIPAPSGSGPATQIQAPLAPAPPQSSPQLPVAAAQELPRDTHIPGAREGSRSPSLVLGILLAIAAVSLVGAAVFVLTKGGEHHKAPTLVEAGPMETPTAPTATMTAAPPAVEQDAAPPLEDTPIVPAPPLVPTPTPTLPPAPSHAAPHRHHDAGAHTDVCAKARQAKAANMPAATVTALENQCRARGGTP